MSKSFLLGKFKSPDSTLDALKQLHKDGIHVDDVYSPFPIHGIEPYLGIKRTRLSIAAFIYGVTGVILALLFQGGLYTWVWPMNIGGKPSLALPSFAPITFEMMVFFAAHGMVLTFFIIGGYFPGKKAKLMDERQTDDVFVIAIDESHAKDKEYIGKVFAENGAFEVTEKTV